MNSILAAGNAVPMMIERGGGVIQNTASNSGVFYDRAMFACTAFSRQALGVSMPDAKRRIEAVGDK